MKNHALTTFLPRLFLYCLGAFAAREVLASAHVVNVNNNGKFSVTLQVRYHAMEGEMEVVYSAQNEVVEAGKSRAFTFALGGGGHPPATKISLVQNTISYWSVVGNSIVADAGENPPAEIPLGEQESPGPVVTFNINGGGSELGGVQVLPDERKTLWMVSDTELTADLFREGIDKIVGFAGDTAAGIPAGGGGGGSGGENFTGDNVEKIATRQELVLTQTGVAAETLSFEGLNVPAPSGFTSKMTDASTKAGNSFRDLLKGATGDPVLTPTVTPGGGAAPDMVIAMPALLGGHSINLNPFTEGRFGTIAAWCRAAISWFVLIGLALWIWDEVDKKVVTAAQAQQAKGNTVAGTGGQITALIAAALMTVAITVFVTAMLTWTFGSIGFSMFRGLFGTDPFGTMASGSLWMLDQLVPVATVVLAIVAKLSFKLYVIPLHGLCVTVIRFFVP